MHNKTIETELDKLPVDLKKEVLDYIEFLLQKYNKRMKKEKIEYTWQGGLSDLKEKVTSVELQHKALEWR